MAYLKKDESTSTIKQKHLNLFKRISIFDKIKFQQYHFLLFSVAVIYITITSYVSLRFHESFETNAWDLGIYDQSLYTTLRYGKFFYFTAAIPGNPGGSFFGIHFSPFLFFLLPIYALCTSPATLLVLRQIIISVGLVPLFWFAREELKSQVLVLLFAIVYLLYPPTLVPLTNFDLEAFLPTLFLFSLYYLKHEKLLRAYFFVILALMINEFVPLIVMAMAVYFFLFHRKEIIDGLQQRKLTKDALFSITLFLSGILWFGLASAVITYFNPTALSTKWEWGEFGTSPGEIVLNVLLNPTKTITVLFNDGQKKFLYITSLLGPVAFLSLLDPITLIMTLPWLVASLLSINPLYYVIETQYPAFVSAFIFISAINGMKKLLQLGGRQNLKNHAFLMLATLLITTLLLPTGGYFEDTKSDETTRVALKEIPASASASVMPEVFPHLSNRLEVYPYFKSGVDYVLINVYSWWYTVSLPRPTHIAPRWCDAEIDDEYGIVVNANGIVLYKKGYSDSVRYFEGVNFTYTSHDVGAATGKIFQDYVMIGSSYMKADVLMHGITDPTPLFFKVPQMVLPPGIYNATMKLKVSSNISGEVITLEISKEPENAKILTKRINGADFTPLGGWQTFNFNFTIKKPTFIEIAAYVTNSTDIYFYSMNILQVSGGK